MIAHSLVYIHSDGAGDEFVGCGVLTEGEYIVTCRHVWLDALAHRPNGEDSSRPKITVVYPYSLDKGVAARGGATLVREFEFFENRFADLAILKPLGIPDRTAFLKLVMDPANEIGPGFAIAGCRGMMADDPDRVRDLTIEGVIAGHLDAEGLRQFSGSAEVRSWFTPGSSGSPIFVKGGEQLVGIVRLSTPGKGTDRRQEAFVIPGSIIGRALRTVEAEHELRRRNTRYPTVSAVLDASGADGVAVATVSDRIGRYIADAQAHAETPAPPSQEGDIAAAVGASRDLVQGFEPGKALDLLRARLAEEDETHRRRRLPLLKEQAAVQRIVFDHEGALATLREIADLDPSDVWTWIAIGEIGSLTGRLEAATAAFRVACAAAVNDRDMAAAQNSLGDMLVAQGDSEGALVAYQNSLSIAEGLAQQDPANANRQRELSVCHDRIGEMLMARGNSEGALIAYSAGLAIAEELAQRDPANAEWQHDLSVSHRNVGDILRAQGDNEGALVAYRASLGLREMLVRRDPTNTMWQRDLSVSHNRAGDLLLVQGDSKGALAAYRASLGLREALVRCDPANTEWQRDLSVSHSRVGDVSMAQADSEGALAAYRASLAIAEALARRDPANTEWQRDLSIGHDRIGDVFMAQGDGEGALTVYRISLALRETLARRDPANAEWQRDLLVSHGKIGCVLAMQGNSAGALTSYQAGLAIAETLVQRDSANIYWQRDLIVSSVELSELQPAEARSHLTRALAIAVALRDGNRLAPVDHWMPDDLAARLAALPPA